MCWTDRRWPGYSLEEEEYQAADRYWDVASDFVSNCSSDEPMALLVRADSWTCSSQDDETCHWESPALAKRRLPDWHSRPPVQTDQNWSPNRAKRLTRTARKNRPARIQDAVAFAINVKQASFSGSWDSSPVNAPPRVISHAKHSRPNVPDRGRTNLIRPLTSETTQMTSTPAAARSSPYRQQNVRSAGKTLGSKGTTQGTSSQDATRSASPKKGQPRGPDGSMVPHAKTQGSDLLMELLDEGLDGSRRVGARQGASGQNNGRTGIRGYAASRQQAVEGQKLSAKPLGMQLVEAMLKAGSHRANGQAGEDAALSGHWHCSTGTCLPACSCSRHCRNGLWPATLNEASAADLTMAMPANSCTGAGSLP